MAHEWLACRVAFLQADGSDITLGSDDWKSCSLNFLGTEGIISEFIAGDADASKVSSTGANPHMLSISGVGVGFGVEDVLATVATLS